MPNSIDIALFFFGELPARAMYHSLLEGEPPLWKAWKHALHKNACAPYPIPVCPRPLEEMPPMPLTDAQLRQLKPKEKPYKTFDGGGLYIEVFPDGAKRWRYKYRIGGKEKRLALGVYPSVSLKEARKRHAEARARLDEGLDPSEVKKATEASQAGVNSFAAIALEWHAKFSPTWSVSHRDKLLGRLKIHILPWLGQRPVEEITAPELLTVIRRIEDKGHLETAHRTLELCGQVLRYAVQTGRAERNCAADLKGAIPPPQKKHFAAILDPVSMGHLLRAIDNYPGHFPTVCGLRLAPLLFMRPGELRMLEWEQVDFDQQELRLPIEHMKRLQVEKNAGRGDIAHIVPLCHQAMETLRALHSLTGGGRYVFPGLRSKDRPMSNATLLNALRRMGYTGEEMTMHGFRHMASTHLHELG